MTKEKGLLNRLRKYVDDDPVYAPVDQTIYRCNAADIIDAIRVVELMKGALQKIYEASGNDDDQNTQHYDWIRDTAKQALDGRSGKMYRIIEGAPLEEESAIKI